MSYSMYKGEENCPSVGICSGGCVRGKYVQEE